MQTAEDYEPKDTGRVRVTISRAIAKYINPKNNEIYR